MTDETNTADREGRTPFRSGGRSQILRVIKSPLGFFALALLIVEGFLLGAGKFFDLPVEIRVAALAVGVILFLIVVSIVYNLVVYHPQNLVFSEESHVRYAEMRIFGTSENARTIVEIERLPAIPAPNPPLGQLPAPKEEKKDPNETS